MSPCGFPKYLLRTLICWLYLFSGGSRADAQPLDSTLSQDVYLSLIRAFHPVARQAIIVEERAAANLTAARAGFDPLLSLQTERKTFDGKNYYEHINPELRIPTWYGIEVAGGLERNLGDLLNPEFSRGRSSYLGLTVPIAKNLLMDKRRAVLQQARLMRDQSTWERRLLLNDLLHDAVVSYWKWVQAHLVHQLLTDAVDISGQRLRLVREVYRQGDRPAIDTTEALTQLQAFILARNEAALQLVKSRLEISDFLWKANDTPWYLPSGIRPDTGWQSAHLRTGLLPELPDILEVAVRNHPKLKVIDFKLRSLEVERRLKFQDLLPKVDLKYNLLSKGYATPLHAGVEPFRNDFKFGIGMAMPMRLSQGRGLYRDARLKIQDARLGQAQITWELENKVRYQHGELVIFREQLEQAFEYVRSHERLWRGEEARFRFGESSLFLVNSRESKLIEAREKLISVQTKYMISLVSLQWSAGQLQ